jgi:hypothetical protein
LTVFGGAFPFRIVLSCSPNLVMGASGYRRVPPFLICPWISKPNENWLQGRTARSSPDSSIERGGKAPKIGPSAPVAQLCQSHQVLGHRYLAERRTSISRKRLLLSQPEEGWGVSSQLKVEVSSACLLRSSGPLLVKGRKAKSQRSSVRRRSAQNQPIHAYSPPYRRGEMTLRGTASARK